jgi:type I restriction enzyme, S subunit
MTGTVKTLGEVVVRRPGTRNPAAAPSETFTYVDLESVDRETKKIASPKVLATRDAPSRARKVIREKDVLVAMVRPNLNAVAMVPTELDDQIASTGFCVLRATEEVLPEYLYYAVRTPMFVQKLCGLVSGALYPAVTERQVLDQPIRVPALPEQLRIVDLLSRAENIVRMRREAEAKAREIIPALFVDMFGDPGRNSKSWPVRLLPELLSEPFKNGLYLSKEHYSPAGSALGVEMVHMSDAFYGQVKRGSLRRVNVDPKELSEYLLTDLDLLVARRSLNREGAAKLSRLPPSAEPIVFESSFIRLRPKQDVVLTDYLYHYMNNPLTRAAFVEGRINGITISGINQSALSTIPVTVPALPFQRAFCDAVQRVRGLETIQTRARVAASSSFQSLLAGVFQQ